MYHPRLCPPDQPWPPDAGSRYRPSWSGATGSLNDEQARSEQAADDLGPDEAAKLYEIGYHSGAILLEAGCGSGAGARVLLRGALRGQRERQAPPPQYYGLDPVADAIRHMARNLTRARLADHALLYHGDLARFHRDLPITPTAVCLNGDASHARTWADLHTLSTFAAPGTPVLCRHGAAGEVRRAIDEWLESGFFEWMGQFGNAVLLRASQRCTGHVQGLQPEHFERQSQVLLNRYLSPMQAGLAADRATPVGALTRPSRNRWLTAATERGGSGHAPWPYGAPHAQPLPPTLPDGTPWPRISVITPTYNQGRFIEQTILSVLNQGYPNVEHIIMDGGSTDETLAILESYRHRLACVVSEKDRGQSHAINKGFARATGEICTWLNSDDMFAPGALAAVALAFHTSGADMVAGICQLHAGGPITDQHLTSCGDGPLPLDDLLDVEGCWLAGQFFYQPEVLFTRSIWEKAGGHVNEALYFSMDYELWLRFAAQGARLHVIGRPVALYRQHPEQKTFVLERFRNELRQARDDFVQRRTGGVSPQGEASGSGCLPRKAHAPRSSVERKSKLRLTFFNDIGLQFGAGTAHGRLAQAAALAGHDVEVVGVTWVPSIYTDPLAENEAILRELEQARPDLVVLGNLHGASLHPDTIGQIARRWPTAFVLHDVWALTGRCAYPGTCEKYLTGCDHACPTPNEYPRLEPERIHDFWAAKRRLLTSPDAPVLLTDSEWLLHLAERALGPGGRMGAIRYGFPLDVFHPRDQRLCRELLDLPQDRFILLASGTTVTDPRKGLRHLAEALHLLQLPDVLVVGIGHVFPEQVPPIPGMRALGYIDDPRRLAMLYSAVDLFVGPSLEEAFGQVFVEAAACGTPSVGYPVGGVPEALVDGITGRIAAAVEPEALAEAIEELYRNPDYRRALGQWGRRYVENEYSLASAWHRLITTLARLGMRDRLQLVPKISLREQPPVLKPTRHVDRNVPRWRALAGFGAWEEPPRRSGLPRSCRALGPVSRLELHAPRDGRHSVRFTLFNQHAGQRLRLVQEGQLVAEVSVPVTAPGKAHSFVVELDLRHGANPLELHHWKWDTAEPGRPTALQVVGIEPVYLGGRGTGRTTPRAA